MQVLKLTRAFVLMAAILAMFLAFPATAKAAEPDDGISKQQISEIAPATVIIADPKIPLGGRQASSSLFTPILAGGVLFAQWPILYFLSKKRIARREGM